MKKSQALHVELIKPIKRPKQSEQPKQRVFKKTDRRFTPSLISKGRNNLGYFFHFATSRSGHNFVRENIFSWVNHKQERSRRYYDLENYKPEHFPNDSKNTDLFKYPHSVTLIQVRDLLNWYASIVLFVNKSRSDDPLRYVEFYLSAWEQIAKEYCGKTNYLQNPIRLQYEDFFTSEEYRRNICQQIKGAEYNEDKINRVTVAGKGSSFTGFDYEGKASEMQVLDRYNQIPEDYQHWWKVLMEHPQIVELYLKYFDVDDEKKEFIDKIK